MRLGMHPRLPARGGGFTALFLSLTVIGTSPAAVIHVPGDQPTIQAGVDAAQLGDMVLVAPGTYTGAGNINVNVTKDIAIVSEGGPEVTTIDMQGSGHAFTLRSNLPASARVEGFTITGGTTIAEGGGIRIDQASPTIRNCVFIMNYAGQGGGGMAVLSLDSTASVIQPTIENCTFHSNANGGLLLYGNAISMLIRNCTFTENVGRGVVVRASSLYGAFGASARFEECDIRANTGGGVLFMTGSSDGQFFNCEITNHTTAEDGAGVQDVSFAGRPSFDGCLFARNHSTGRGGGASIAGDQGALFNNCRFEDNSALTGGGLYHTGQSNHDDPVQNCQFIHNSAQQAGGGLYFSTDGIGRLSRNLFWGNSAGQRGGGAYLGRGNSAVCAVISSTLASNSAPEGAGLFVFDLPGPPTLIDHTIIAFSGIGPAVNCQFFTADAICSDLFGNAGGDWVACVSGELGTDSNIALDPMFCDAPNGDFRVSSTSPCAPPQSACGLIGAYDVGCGLTSVEPSTWGSVKAAFYR